MLSAEEPVRAWNLPFGYLPLARLPYPHTFLLLVFFPSSCHSLGFHIHHNNYSGFSPSVSVMFPFGNHVYDIICPFRPSRIVQKQSCKDITSTTASHIPALALSFHVHPWRDVAPAPIIVSMRLTQAKRKSYHAHSVV